MFFSQKSTLQVDHDQASQVIEAVNTVVSRNEMLEQDLL